MVNPEPACDAHASASEAATVSGTPSGALRPTVVKHGKWTIYFDPPPIPARDLDWAFSHENYDASWEGEEDGWASNGLAGRGASIDDCKNQIADMEAEGRS